MPNTLVGNIEIYTYKAGILSKIAHDLRLSLPPVTLTLDGQHLECTIPLTDVRVDGVMTRTGLKPDLLSLGDQSKIIDTINTIILKTHKHPTARLSAEIIAGKIVGSLTLCGRTQAVSWPLTDSGEEFAGTAPIKPSNWGIKPYRAMLGAIQLQDRIEARFIFRR